MLRILTLFCMIMAAVGLRAGCNERSMTYVNGFIVFACEAGLRPYYQIEHMWAGKCYIDSVFGDYLDVHAHLYFQPGDTIRLESGIVITQTGTYEETIHYCDPFTIDFIGLGV